MEENVVFGVTVFVLVVLAFLIVRAVIKVVPQSEVYVIERFGKYRRTLNAGLSVLTPVIDRVAHRVSILERQLPEQLISVITKDNVEVQLKTRVFYRVVDAANSVYRIRNVNEALHTAASSIVRSAAGKLELDDLQSSREAMNIEIQQNLLSAAEVWGVQITRTEITDVIIDSETKDSQRQQLNADRKRRATVAEAEGEKRSVELRAEADLYRAQKEAEAVKIAADAQAYAILAKAKADADQTRFLAKAIADDDGAAAIAFEVAKLQVEAVGRLAASDNSKTIILPTDVTKSLGVLSSLLEGYKATKND